MYNKLVLHKTYYVKQLIGFCGSKIDTYVLSNDRVLKSDSQYVVMDIFKAYAHYMDRKYRDGFTSSPFLKVPIMSLRQSLND